MKKLILKYSTRNNNYWGNSGQDGPVIFQTYLAIAWAIYDCNNSGGNIFLCNIDNRKQFYGPVQLENQLESQNDGFYRYYFEVNFDNPVCLKLSQALSNRLLACWTTANAVMIDGNTVKRFNIDTITPGIPQRSA